MNSSFHVGGTVPSLILAIQLVACSAPPAPPEHICESAGAILNGAEAKSPMFDAIGALGVPDGHGAYRFFCSATLIAPAIALTAKHCTMTGNGESLLDRGPVVFALGLDAEHPLSIVE